MKITIKNTLPAHEKGVNFIRAHTTPDIIILQIDLTRALKRVTPTVIYSRENIDLAFSDDFVVSIDGIGIDWMCVSETARYTCYVTLFKHSVEMRCLKVIRA